MRQNFFLPAVCFFCFLDREDDDEDVEALLYDNEFNSDDGNPCCSKIFFNQICNKSNSLTLGENVAVPNLLLIVFFLFQIDIAAK